MMRTIMNSHLQRQSNHSKHVNKRKLWSHNFNRGSSGLLSSNKNGNGSHIDKDDEISDGADNNISSNERNGLKLQRHNSNNSKMKGFANRKSASLSYHNGKGAHKRKYASMNDLQPSRDSMT